MKFERFDYATFENDWYFLPTIRVFFDNPLYGKHNISLEIHWLIAHARWLFIEKE